MTPRANDIERFDHWSRTYEQSWMQRVFFDPAHRATLALAAGIVHQPESVLDIGCGTGKLLRQARTCWPEARLIGVDPANGMIELAKRLTPTAAFLTGMAEALPLHGASVDLALSPISFHHSSGSGGRPARNRAGTPPWRVRASGGCVLPGLAGALLASEACSRSHSPSKRSLPRAGLQIQAQQRIA